MTAPNPLRRHGLAIAAVLATTVPALLVAACSGGSGSSTGTAGSSGAAGSSTSASAVAYSACMRSHGVPNYPDPDSSGNLPKPDAHQFGVSSSQLHATQQACHHLLPNTGGAIDAASIQQCMQAHHCPQPLVQEVLDEERKFAGCMRANGVPNWPDPITDSLGRPVFAISISKDGFNPYSAQIWAKGNHCSHLMPGLPGLPAAVSP
ncbi:MAG: hypothetical protein ACRDP6_27560 [Actinoallomurus sp.]